MTGAKGSSISWSDFIRDMPNGSWVRQLKGKTIANLELPVEGVLHFDDVDEIKATKVSEHTLLKVTPITQLDTVLLRAGDSEFKVGDDDWIGFRELCIRSTERRLDEVKAVSADDAHPFRWMTHKDELNMSLAQIGTQLYDVATWIEANGNRGYSDDDLMKALPQLRIRVLGNAYKLIWENILFFGEGGRKRDFDGWGVHKYKPAHWTRTWLERFGLDHPQAEALTDSIWDEALADYAKRAVKRLQLIYAGVDLEQALTRDVAHKAAAMWLLSRWAQRRAWQHWAASDLWKLQSRLYHDAYIVFRQELLYRQDQQPEKRRSKKKTQDARDDWATASGYFDAARGFGAQPEFNPHRFYTEDFIEACCESDSAPDLVVDFDQLPRGLREAIDVRAVDAQVDIDEVEV